MVSLPAVEDYSSATQESVKKYSPVFESYSSLLSRTPNSFSDEIRIEKHKAWLDCAIATHSDEIHPEEVCKYWSEQTNRILKKVWDHCDL